MRELEAMKPIPGVLRVLLVYFMLSFVAHVAMAAESENFARFAKGLELFNQKRFAEAESAFEAIPADAPEYRYAFIELQKIHYRTGQWDKFFGYASFYRKKLAKQFAAPELPLLETLALSRHCQFLAAEAALSTARLQATNDKSEEMLSKVQAVDDLLFLQTKVPGNVNATPVSPKARVFSSVSEWKIPETNRQAIFDMALHNARAVRVYVTNLCSRSKS